MTSFTLNRGHMLLTKMSLVVVMIIITMASCDLFFRKELRQDRKLLYYRYQAYKISDSIDSNQKRIKAYKALIKDISEDEHLITPRKKNMLLSEVYNTLGTQYFDAYMITEAIENSSLAIMLNVNNSKAYYNRACLHQFVGYDSLALEDYAKAIDNNDKFADAYYNRGILYEKNTDFQLAVEDFSRAIKLNPPYLADVYNNRGNTYQEMNFFEKAIADYDAALRLDSTKAIFYNNRADAYMQLGNQEKALSDYKTAAQIDSANVVILDKIKLIMESFNQPPLVEKR